MELKTGKVSKQITKQLQHYAKFFDYFYVLVKANEVDRLVNIINKRYGVILVDDAEVSITLIRPAQRNKLSKECLLELMKPYTLRWITIVHKLGFKPTVLRKMKRQELAQIISKKVDDETVRDIYYQYVLGEKYNWWFNLTNQEYYKMYPQFKAKVMGSLTLDKFVED